MKAEVFLFSEPSQIRRHKAARLALINFPRVIHRHTGQLIRELILDPTRDYQPRGLPPGPPKRDPGGIPIPAQSAARSRSQGWPKATRRAPALTSARTAPPSPAGMPKHPTTATMSQDTC
jgi:hypothetical protein